MLSTIVLVRAETRRTSRLVSIPFSVGMARSTTARSGPSSPASRTPSWPSAASPRTWSPSRSRSTRTPWRTMAWSSMSRIVVAMSALQRDPGRQYRAMARGGADQELAAQRLQPLPHPHQPKAPRAVLGGGRVESDSVVAHVTRQRAVAPLELDVGPPGPSVLGHVGQRSLDDPIQRDLHRRSQSLPGGPFHGDRQPGPLRHALRQVLDGRDQPELVQHRWPQLVGEAPELLVDLVEERAELLQALLHRRRRITGDLVDREIERRQELSR